MNKQVERLDFFPDINDYMIEPFKENAQGFLVGRAVVTNTGIFRYVTKDGIINELRAEDEVGKQDSLDTLKNISMTNDHPAVFVTPDNAKELSVGLTSNDVYFDNHRVSVTITITDKKAIQDVKDGKVGLSCGYTAVLVMRSGERFGNIKYDAVQTDIRYNHVAIVPAGRAGELATINLRTDAGDNIGYLKNQLEEKMPENNMKSIKIDGVDFQAEAQVIIEVTKLDKENKTLQTKIDELTKSNSTLQARLDNSTQKLTLAENELKENKIDESVVNKRVKEVFKLIDIAKEVKAEYDIDNLDTNEIKKAIIMTRNAEAFKVDRDQNYIDAYVDIIIDEHKKGITPNAQAAANTQIVFADSANPPTQEKTKKDRYQEFCVKLEDDSHLQGGV